MSILRFCPTLLLLCGVCFALNLPDQDLLNPEERTCSGEACPEDDGDSMPVHEFLALTDHEHVPRKKDESKAANVDVTDRAKDGIVTDGSKDIILNKLLKNAGRQKPNKLQGPSLIARYVQGIRGALDSDNDKIKDEKTKDESAKLSKRDVDVNKDINFMSEFLDMDPLSIKTNETDDVSGNDAANETELENQDLTLNITEKQDAIETEVENQDLTLNITEKQDANETEVENQDLTLNITEKQDAIETEVENQDLTLNITEKQDANDTELENQDLTLNITEKQDDHLDFMANFLDDDHMEVQINATENDNVNGAHANQEANVTDTSENDNDHFEAEKSATDTELENQDLELNLTEKQDNHLDFMANFLDDDHMDIQINANATEQENVPEADTNNETNVTDTSENVNVTENTVNDTADASTGIVEKQLDFLADFLEEDPLETVSAIESIESEADSLEIEERKEEIEKSTGDNNQLDFVTNFLNSDPLETEAIDRSDAVEISAIQEENLDFLTDFLSEDPAAVEANSDDELAPENEIPQDILELYSEDEVQPEHDQVPTRKKPISSNVEWVRQEPKEPEEEESSSVWWSWFGF